MPFDTAQESEQWLETRAINQQMPPAATQSSEDGSDISTWTNWLFIICTASLALFALVGLIALIVRSG